MPRRLFVFVVVSVFCSFSAIAQTAAGPDPEKVRIEIGPLWILPTLALTNAGVDSNVFNEPDEAGPKRDFTMTVTPAAELWLHLGRTWLTGDIKEDVVYYHKYASERSVNSRYKANWLAALNRLTLNVGSDRLSTRERPGFEIDARSQHDEVGFEGSLEVWATPKTAFALRMTRRRVNFDSFATYDGTSLRDALNRTLTTASISVRNQVTPFTGLTLNISRDRDRFEFSPFRDSTSTAVTGGIELNQFALIKGSASFGFRNFQPRLPGVPGYEGSTAAVNLSYVAFTTMRVSVQGTRDVQYSYLVSHPYYLLTAGSASISQQIFGPLDVTARVGVQRLDYRDRADADVVLSNPTDYVHTFGGGVGCRLGQGLRLGVNVDRVRRTSGVDFRRYNGLTYGTAVTYVR